MHRADQHTQQQIADLVEACAGYWELRGIAREGSHEMQLELEQHLQQAVTDGKSLEAVLGPNPLAFADAWAREMRPRFWRGGAVVLRGLVYALSVVSTSALLSQLLVHAPAFTFTLFAAYLLIGSGLLALLLQLGGFLAPRISTRAGREALLLSWSWPTTIVLLALAVFLFALHSWRPSHSEHTFSVRRVPMCIASVAVFDVMLFVASVALVDFCRLALRLM